MYKTAKNLFLLAIIVAASIVSAINMPQTASAAAANLYLSEKIKTQAKQNALRNTLALCMTVEVRTLAHPGGVISMGKDRDGTATESEIAEGNWFYDKDEEPQARIGYMVDPDDGEVECRNLFDGRNVAKDLGFAGNTELACGIGMTRTNGSNCLDGSGDFKGSSSSRDKIFDAIKAKTGVNGYNNAQLYALAATTYLTTCGGKAVVNLDEASTDQKNNTEKYDQIKVVTGTRAIKEVLFTKKNNDKKAFRNLTNGDFSYIIENCNWMKDRMNEYAGAYAAWVKDGNQAPNGDEAGSGIDPDEEEEEETVTCAVPGIGWIICPVINNLLAPVVDAAYGYVASLLTVQPLNVTPGANNPLYSAWSAMRDFANIAFVIAFLMIVFSQLTNIGVTNYGIKKMLPRLIIAAILVNASYWICAIAVDISNIAGSSMRGVFQGITNNLATPDYSGSETGDGAAGWVGLSAALLITTGAALYIGLSALIPALILVLFTIITVFITLAIRQALIILLIVVAPLAFVAYLLPNTESLFTKWRKLFMTLLLLYPIIGLLFGASELASKIVTDAAPKGEGVSAGYTMAFQIMGAMIAVIPIVVAPAMLKGAKALGGIVNTGLGKKLNNSSLGQKTGEKYRGYRQNQRKAAALTGGKVIGAGQFKRSYRRELRNKAAEDSVRSAQGQFGVTDEKASKYAQSSALSNAQANALSNANNTRLVSNIARNPGLVSSGMGPAAADEHVDKALDAQQKRAVADAIKEVELTADINPGDIGAMATLLENALKSGDTITARAMQNSMLQSGNPGVDAYRKKMIEMEGQQNTSGENVLNDNVMGDMRQNVLSNHSKIKGSAADIMKQATSGGTLSGQGTSASTWKLADSELATQKASSMNLALDAKDAGGNFAVDKAQAERILDNPDLAKSIANSDIRNKLLARAGRPVPPSPSPAPSPPSPPSPPPSPPPGPGTP